MKRLIILGLLIICIAVSEVYCQYVKRMKFKIPSGYENKSTNDNLFLISPDFQMTGLVIRIDTSDSFDDSYVIAENDTIYIIEDEHLADTSSFLSSNLIVFKSKISEFRFYPRAIDKEIEFIFINASPSKKVLRKIRRKKKRCRLFRTLNN